MEEIYKDSFWTGYYTSRSNSKLKIREFSSYNYLTNTLYSLDRFKFNPSNLVNLTAESEWSFKLAGEVGLLQHHDTITGTSYQYVADDYIYQIDNHTLNNSQLFIPKMLDLTSQQGLSFNSLSYCMHSLNKRYLCPGGAPSFTKQGDELYLSVYNPYHEDQEFVNIFLNTSKVQIFAWYPYQKSFQPAKAEAFCYPSPDKNTTYECEVYI
jgi:hypothetical protein